MPKIPKLSRKKKTLRTPKLPEAPKLPKMALSPYVVKVRKKNSSEPEDLDNLFGEGKTLFDIIKEIKSDYKLKPYNEDKNKKAIKFENKAIEYNINKGVRITQDIVYYGEYGVLRKVMNIDTGEINQAAINSNESPVYDLTFTYAQDSLVKGHGILIVQSYSRMSYKTVLTELIKNKLNSIFENELSLDINPLVDDELIELIEKGGRVVEINLISHDISKESADILLESKKNQIEVRNTNKITLALTSSNGTSLAPIKDLQNLINNLRNVVNSTTTPFYEVTKCYVNTVKIKVSTDSQNYTFCLDQDDSGDFEFKKIIPLNDDSLISNDGVINNGSILVLAREHIESIANKYRSGKYK